MEQEQKHNRSILAQLRAFAPHQPIRYAEALRIAEHQAYWLLHLAHLRTPPVGTEAMTSLLPRLQIEYSEQRLVSGSAHWSGQHWVVVLSVHERAARQRLALAHELKHVIDHTTRGYLYTGMPAMSPGAQAEHAADYFAGCLLVPRTWLRAACAHGPSDDWSIARIFQVPVPIARLRLQQCGLASRRTRRRAQSSAYRDTHQEAA